MAFIGNIAFFLFVLDAEQITEAIRGNDVRKYARSHYPYNVAVLVLFAIVAGIVIRHSKPSFWWEAFVYVVVFGIWMWRWGCDLLFLLHPANFEKLVDQLEGKCRAPLIGPCERVRMLMPNTWRWVAFLVVAAALAGIAARLVPLLSDYCTSRLLDEQAVWRQKFICEIKITDVIIAGFTVFLALFTGFLVLVGVRQMRLTRDAMISGERAYVFAKGINGYWELDPNSGEYNWRFRAILENTGDTPTKNMTMGVNCKLRDSPPPPGFNFDYQGPIVGTALIPPRTVTYGGLAPSPLARAITPQDLAAIQAGQKLLYIWGWARYFDVFPETPQHITRYCFGILPGGNFATFRPGAQVEFQTLHHGEGNCADDECGA